MDFHIWSFSPFNAFVALKNCVLIYYCLFFIMVLLIFCIYFLTYCFNLIECCNSTLSMMNSTFNLTCAVGESVNVYLCVCVCVFVCVHGKRSRLISDYLINYYYDHHCKICQEHITVSPYRTLHLTTRKPTGLNLLL
jgi:hypothetical protein